MEYVHTFECGDLHCTGQCYPQQFECLDYAMCTCGKLSCPRHLVNLFDRPIAIKLLENTLDGLDELQTKYNGLTDDQIVYYNDCNDKLKQFKAERLIEELEEEKATEDYLADATYRLQHPGEFCETDGGRAEMRAWLAS